MRIAIFVITMVVFMFTLPAFGQGEHSNDGFKYSVSIIVDKIIEIKQTASKFCFEDIHEDPLGRKMMANVYRSILKGTNLFPNDPELNAPIYGASNQFPGSSFNCINKTGVIKAGINEYYLTDGEVVRIVEFEQAVRFETFLKTNMANIVVSDNNRQSLSIIANINTNEVFFNDVNLNITGSESEQAEYLVLKELNKNDKRGVKNNLSVTKNALLEVINRMYFRLALEKGVSVFDFAMALLIDPDVRINIYSVALMHSQQEGGK